MIELNIIYTTIPPNSLGLTSDDMSQEDIILYDYELFQNIKPRFHNFNYPFIAIADYQSVKSNNDYLFYLEFIFKRSPREAIESKFNDEMDINDSIYMRIDSIANNGIKLNFRNPQPPHQLLIRDYPVIRNIVEFSATEMIPKSIEALEQMNYKINRYKID